MHQLLTGLKKINKMKKDLFSIKNKVIIITGGGSGIGWAIAKGMAQEKAIVFCFDINFTEKKSDHSFNNIFQVKVDKTTSC